MTIQAVHHMKAIVGFFLTWSTCSEFKWTGYQDFFCMRGRHKQNMCQAEVGRVPITYTQLRIALLQYTAQVLDGLAVFRATTLG